MQFNRIERTFLFYYSVSERLIAPDALLFYWIIRVKYISSDSLE